MSIYSYLKSLRERELEAVLEVLPASISRSLFEAPLLDFGSGNGTALVLLQSKNPQTVGVDVAAGSMAAGAVEGVVYYDGITLPFPKAAFANIFSSHVMEHIPAFSSMLLEHKRVLAPGGVAVHVLPTSAWRVASWLTHPFVQPRRFIWALWRAFFPAPVAVEGEAYVPPVVGARPLTVKLLDTLWPPRHGEFGNRLTEVFALREAAWNKRFVEAGWHVDAVYPLPYFYTDGMLFGGGLPWWIRRFLGRFFPSSKLYVVRPI